MIQEGYTMVHIDSYTKEDRVLRNRYKEKKHLKKVWRVRGIVVFNKI